MQKTGAAEQVEADFIAVEQCVGAVPAVEGEAALSCFGNGNHCEGGRSAAVGQHTRDVHTVFRERPAQETAVVIIADLADKSGIGAKTRRSDRYVGRRSAGVRGVKGNAVFSAAVG